MMTIDKKFKHVALEYILRRVKNKTILIPELPAIKKQQSILNILLLDLSLPPIVVIEDSNGVHDVKINGDIIATIIAFMKNDIKHEKSGHSLDTLPNRNYNHVMDYTLHFVILDPSNSEESCDTVIKDYQYLC